MTPSRDRLLCFLLLLLSFISTPARSATLEGQVVDPEGEPVPGAQVWALDEKEEPLGTAVAGTNGSFEINNLRETRSMMLYACQDGYSLGASFLGHPRQRPVQLILAPGVRLAGRVRDPQGQPIEGAKVVANSVRVDLEYNGPDIIPCSGAAQALSKKDGTFSLGPLPPGIWTLNAEAKGRIPIKEIPLARSWNQSNLTGIEIALKPEVTGILTGHVLDPEGAPVAGAQVVLYSNGYHRFQTGEDGSFELSGIPTGKHRVSAEYPSYSTTDKTLTIKEGENRADLQFRQKRTEIRGRVEGPDGQPVAGATVSVAVGSEGITREDGSFLAWATPISTNFISALKSGYFPDPQSYKVRVRGDKPDQYVELRLYPATSVSGRIKGLSPEELAHARVYGYYGERSDALVFPQNGRIDGRVEADGHYRIENLSSVTSEGIAIVADTGGRTHRSVSAEVPVEPGQREAMVDLEFPPTYTVRGRVLDPDGQPLAGVSVSLLISGQGFYSDYTREDGSFSLRVESGDYTTHLYRQGYANEERSGPDVRDAPVENLEIRLHPGSEIRGQILGIKPEESVYVSADGPGRGAGDETDLEGEYWLSGLSPGEWDVTARSDLREVRSRVSLQPGEKTSLDLDLRFGPLTLSGRLLDDGKPAEDHRLELRSAEDPSFVYSRNGWDGRSASKDFGKGPTSCRSRTARRKRCCTSSGWISPPTASWLSI